MSKLPTYSRSIKKDNSLILPPPSTVRAQMNQMNNQVLINQMNNQQQLQQFSINNYNYQNQIMKEKQERQERFERQKKFEAQINQNAQFSTNNQMIQPKEINILNRIHKSSTNWELRDEFSLLKNFNEDQNIAKDLLNDFVKTYYKKPSNELPFFFMMGYAGTGKTYMMSLWACVMLLEGIVNNIAICSPTHSALNKINSDVKMAFDTISQKIHDNEKMNTLINQIKFMTIHGLLDLKSAYDSAGNLIFVNRNYSKYGNGSRNNNSNYGYNRNQQQNNVTRQDNSIIYDIVIIDECSMISADLYSKIKIYTKTSECLTILMGDSRQLLPVKENISPVFIDVYGDDYMKYKTCDPPIRLKYGFQLKTLMRSSKMDIKYLLTAIRFWDPVEKLIPLIVNLLKQFPVKDLNNSNGGTIEIYSDSVKLFRKSTLLGNNYVINPYYSVNVIGQGNKQYSTNWFICIQELLNNGIIPVVLAWRNNTVTAYNNFIRMIYLRKDPQNLVSYIEDDIIMFTGFHEIIINDNDEKEKQKRITIEEIENVEEFTPSTFLRPNQLQTKQLEFNDIFNKPINTNSLQTSNNEPVKVIFYTSDRAKVISVSSKVEKIFDWNHMKLFDAMDVIPQNIYGELSRINMIFTVDTLEIIKYLPGNNDPDNTVYTIKTINKKDVKRYNKMIIDVKEIFLKYTKGDFVIMPSKPTEEDIKETFININKDEYNINSMRKNFDKRHTNDMSYIFWHVLYNCVVFPFAPLDYSYSTTIHKAQGSTFDHVFIDIEDFYHNKNIDEFKSLVYTAITRVRLTLFLIFPPMDQSNIIKENISNERRIPNIHNKQIQTQQQNQIIQTQQNQIIQEQPKFVSFSKIKQIAQNMKRNEEQISDIDFFV